MNAFSPDLLIYLAEPRGDFPGMSIYRDYAFFRACGIHRFAGLPLTRSLRRLHRLGDAPPLWEAEAARLGRCMAPSFGPVALADPRNWDLRITAGEKGQAERALAAALGDAFGTVPLIGISIGTKQAINDWGMANWEAVLAGLEGVPHALVLFGSTEDRAASERLVAAWPNASANLCGLLSPRVSAAAMRGLDVMLCHDSGPMHLAAAMGVRCVAVFSLNNPPGKWYPNGPGHTIFYPPPDGDIHATRPPEVVTAVKAALKSVRPAHDLPQESGIVVSK